MLFTSISTFSMDTLDHRTIDENFWQDRQSWDRERKSVARGKTAPIIFDQTHHAGSDVQRSFAEKKDTVWLCAIPEKEGAGLVDVDESRIGQWMRVEIHFHGVIQTNYGAIIAIPNLILWEDRKSPEEELNVFDSIDANCRLKL